MPQGLFSLPSAVRFPPVEGTKASYFVILDTASIPSGRYDLAGQCAPTGVVRLPRR